MQTVFSFVFTWMNSQTSWAQPGWDALRKIRDDHYERWALDWTWIGLDPDYSKFCGIWIGSGL